MKHRKTLKNALSYLFFAFLSTFLSVFFEFFDF